MGVRERLLALKLLEYQKKNAEFVEKIGVKVQVEQGISSEIHEKQ